MLSIDRCQECDIPLPFGRLNTWLSNGDIVQSVFDGARVAFMECENLDPLFESVEDIIGVSIQGMLINVSTWGNRYYLSRMIPREAREHLRAKELEVVPFAEYFQTLARLFGYGGFDMLEFRFENDAEDYAKHVLKNPFSIPLDIGAYASAVSTIAGGDIEVTYEEISPGEYEFVAHRTESPSPFKQKLIIPEYLPEEGDIELQRCSFCGCPRAFSSYEWSLEEGTVRQRHNGRRMALLGPDLIDPVFDELERILGNAFPPAVVEAQRRFVTAGLPSLDVHEAQESLRTQLALRGLGNLRELRTDAEGASLRIDNACMHLVLAGTLQGNYELAFGVESDMKWEFTGESSLMLEIVPRKT
jgi:hypothetical protein